MTDTRTERHADAERLIALLSERASAPETLAEADWRRIVELAQEQGVAPMLYARLQTLGATLPAATAQQLREFYLACVMRNTWLFDEVGKILRALQAAGIPVIPGKNRRRSSPDALANGLAVANQRCRAPGQSADCR
jgi:light-regulated signal transduction histidine kinase (bacteriophytochrome)